MMCRHRFKAGLTDNGLAPIEEVRASLDQRFAPDWYELLWWSQWPTAMLVWLLAFGGTAVAAFGWALWEALIPLAVWLLAARVIPPTLLDRAPYEPVWARRDVLLHEAEQASLATLLKTSAANRLLCGRIPRNGKEAWMLRERAVLRQKLRALIGRDGPST
jgi:hypothetical protein